MEALETLFDLGIETKSRDELACGDQHVAQPFSGGFLLGAIDGLGHGPQAELAARAAAETLRDHAGEPVERLLDRCHRRLLATRGAAIGLLSLDRALGTLEWIGIGNVDGMLIHPGPEAPPAHVHLLPLPGVVGGHMPRLQAKKLRLAAGDLLVLATDGIEFPFEQAIDARDAPGAIARRIIDSHARADDDALVVVARYRRGGP